MAQTALPTSFDFLPPPVLHNERGEVRSENGLLGITRDGTFEDFPHPDIIVFPGGVGTRPLQHDERVLQWVRAAHETTTFTTSVCTGSLILAATALPVIFEAGANRIGKVSTVAHLGSSAVLASGLGLLTWAGWRGPQEDDPASTRDSVGMPLRGEYSIASVLLPRTRSATPASYACHLR